MADPVGRAPVDSATAQFIVALAIVCVLGLSIVVLSVAGVWLSVQGKAETAIWVAVGTAIGSLASSLSSPSGIANVIASAKKQTAGE